MSTDEEAHGDTIETTVSDGGGHVGDNSQTPGPLHPPKQVWTGPLDREAQGQKRTTAGGARNAAKPAISTKHGVASAASSASKSASSKKIQRPTRGNEQAKVVTKNKSRSHDVLVIDAQDDSLSSTAPVAERETHVSFSTETHELVGVTHMVGAGHDSLSSIEGSIDEEGCAGADGSTRGDDVSLAEFSDEVCMRVMCIELFSESIPGKTHG